ncbi:hypothetical protein [Neobacillus sp. SuZ13]|uniref:hypothetical protein n=1 Tax=Neobacillus sp. SuZ13 TaxID=3047875 RepID=UPI0024C0C0B1|nr:hypothetical protein [Neobacillus sp. SuZ13]WHY64668.1 hypothetical protein QNH17_16200 [Neobacillus sp. SuZ13]
MTRIFVILLIFTLTACSSSNSEPTEKVNQELKKETDSRKITEEEQKFINLVLKDDYETLLKETEGKTNQVQQDYHSLAIAFDKENKLEEKVKGTESELIASAIYKKQYEDIKNNLENVHYVPKKIKDKVDDLHTLAKEKFNYYSVTYEEEQAKSSWKYATENPKPVNIGMTQEEVLTKGWGRPIDINTTTTINGKSEQWVYPNNHYLYFEDGILTSIQK